MTDEELRLDFWVQQGMKPSEALRYVRENPGPQTLAEASYLLNNHFKELGAAIKTAFLESTKPIRDLWNKLP